MIYGLLRLVDRRRLRRFHKYSERHRFALELRISLLLLFALAAIATTAHVSTMLAGFTLGLAVGAIGQPRRLARQLFGITEGSSGRSSSCGWARHWMCANSRTIPG